MNNLIRLAFAALACSLVLYISSCGKCGGCDTISATTGAVISTAQDSLPLNKINNDAMPLNMYLVSVSNTRSGDRKCAHKDLKTCFDDGIDSASLKLLCDKELLLKEAIIPAATNLLAIPAVSERKYTSNPGQSNLASLELTADRDFVPGRYTFALSGRTINGKSFTDTVLITWY